MAPGFVCIYVVFKIVQLLNYIIFVLPDYGSLYDPPRPPDNLDQDYENPARLSSEFNSYLTDSRNEREGAQPAAPIFEDIFHDQLRSGMISSTPCTMCGNNLV